jgi:hypothetical protein
MSSKIFTDLPMSDVPSSSGVVKSHFDTFETKFFEQGEQGELDSARLAVEVERFDDLDAGKKRRLAPSRRFVMSVAIGSASLAVVASVLLWRSGGHASSAFSSEGVSAQASQPTPATEPPAPVPQVAAAAQATEPVAAAPAKPSENPPSAAPDNPAAAPAPTQAAAVIPAVAAVAPPEAKVAPEAAEAKPLLADTKVAPAVDAPDPQARCAKAMQSKRTKDVLATCPDALAADPAAPTAVDIAVTLAKIEFDRGRVSQASMWSKKALAADPNAADAYVFLGGAEQTAGHGKAAKEAYKRYLQLAPTGRYASDLRAIVGGL